MKTQEKTKLVHGIGINDADYMLTRYEQIDGKKRSVWTCPFYVTWAGMIRRCYSDNCHITNPSYIGCSVAPEWMRFSIFKAWMERQDWEGKQLDKDILAQGNNTYSPATCVFVSRQLNLFLIDRGANRGKWPLGVCWNKSVKRFVAHCRNPFTGKREHLGYFADPESAHKTWRKRKHQLALIYADQQTDPRIASALRLRFAQNKDS